LLTKHLKEVHGLVAKKAKPRRLSTSEGGHWYQDHAKMNVHILGNAMVVQRWNDQKVVSHTCAKTQHEWDKLITITKHCSPFPKLWSISFKTTIVSVRFQCLGHGKHASKCNITNGKGWKFIRDDSIHPLCICTTIENAMRGKKLGSKV
jgi:hypothetical protein